MMGQPQNLDRTLIGQQPPDANRDYIARLMAGPFMGQKPYPQTMPPQQETAMPQQDQAQIMPSQSRDEMASLLSKPATFDGYVNELQTPPPVQPVALDQPAPGTGPTDFSNTVSATKNNPQFQARLSKYLVAPPEEQKPAQGPGFLSTL